MTLSLNDYVINDCFRLVESVERSVMAEELEPFHGSQCGCKHCVTNRWIQSEDAAEFARRKR
jgi:hypothetical protein